MKAFHGKQEIMETSIIKILWVTFGVIVMCVTALITERLMRPF